MSSESVQAVVVTHNRKALLLECLEGIARQTHAVAGVLVVDNASTDGTEEALEASGLTGRLRIDYLRLLRNGGGAEGFHYGVRRALESGADWIWLMDDDCEPPPRALADLLASPRAADSDAVLLAPIVRSPAGVGPLALWRDLRRGHRFEESWKLNYGLRNLIWCGRRDGYVTRGRLLSYVAVAAVRALLFQRHRLLSLPLAVLYPRDGWRGRFVNVPPDEWAELPRHPRPLRVLRARALRYDRDVDEPVRRLEGGAAARVPSAG